MVLAFTRGGSELRMEVISLPSIWGKLDALFRGRVTRLLRTSLALYELQSALTLGDLGVCYADIVTLPLRGENLSRLLLNVESIYANLVDMRDHFPLTIVVRELKNAKLEGR
jgi:hypothetical protein